MLAVLFALAWACWSASSVLAITVSESSSSYTIDTQSDYGFVVDVDRDNCDITSLQFYGTEYQYSGTHSHIGSGLGTGTQVSYTQSGRCSQPPLTRPSVRPFSLTGGAGPAPRRLRGRPVHAGERPL